MPVDGLVGRLRDEIGVGLRTIALNRGRDYEFLYTRDDIDRSYTREDIERVFDDLFRHEISMDYVENIFRVGEVTGSMIGFEEAVLCHVAGNDGPEAVFVSVDTDSSLEVTALFEAVEDVFGD